jgi:hypothetical protein
METRCKFKKEIKIFLQSLQHETIKIGVQFVFLISIIVEEDMVGKKYTRNVTAQLDHSSTAAVDYIFLKMPIDSNAADISARST